MPRALFTSVNLLGDLVEITPSIVEWSKRNPEYKIEVRIQDQNFGEVLEDTYPWGLIKRVPGDFDLVRTPMDINDYDFFHNFDVQAAAKIAWGEHRHISDGYALSLGLGPLPRKYGPLARFPLLDFPRHKKGYIAITPFAGHTVDERGANERSLPFETWNHIIGTVLDAGLEVTIFGYSQSPWELFKQYVPVRKGLNWCDEESVIRSLQLILNAKGYISPDSGMLHCLSYALKQTGKRNYPVLFFKSNVIPSEVNHPWGVDQHVLTCYNSFCGDLKYDSLVQYLANFIKDVKEYGYR